MDDVIYDAIANVRFFSTVEGGLPSVLDPSLDRLGCRLGVDGQVLECSVVASRTQLGPSVVGDVPIVFLNPEIAKAKIGMGSRIVLQHVSPFAEGVIVDLPWMSDYSVGNRKELYSSIEVLKQQLRQRQQYKYVTVLDDILAKDGSDDVILAELRKEWLALPKDGVFAEPPVKGRIAGLVRYIETRLNAWPSTAIR